MLNLNQLKTNNAKKCKITITSQLVDAGSAMASLPNAANIKKASIAFTTTIWPETCLQGFFLQKYCKKLSL